MPSPATDRGVGNSTVTAGPKETVQGQDGLFAQIVRLAREAPSKARYYTEAAKYIFAPFQTPLGFIEVRLLSEVVMAYCHSGTTDPEFWRPAVQSLVTTSLASGEPQLKIFESKDGDARVATMSALITEDGREMIGAVAMVVTCSSKAEAVECQEVLTSMAELVSSCSAFVGEKQPGGTPTDLSAAQMLARGAGYSSRNELIFSIVNNLRNKSGCDQVALGLTPGGKNVRVVAVSGFAKVKRRSPGVLLVQAAMEECLDHGEVIACQKDRTALEKASRFDYRLHRQWHESVGGSCVLSIPLFVEGRCTAIVSMRRDAASPFAHEELARIERTLQDCAPALELVDRATRGLGRHTLDAAKASVKAAVTPGRWLTKFFTVALVVGMAWFIFGTMEYTITVPCSLEPTAYRHFSAPSEGILSEAPVVAGDRVAKGQLLFSFDTRELETARMGLQAELAIVELEATKARAQDDIVSARLAEAGGKKLGAQLAVIEQKIAAAVVRAPFDGIVTRGDQRRRIGEMLPRGEPMYEVSSEEGWTLRMLVPESEIEATSDDLSGYFASYARPGQSHAFRISRRSPSAEQHKGSTVYAVEARIDSPPEWMRSGMEGVGKISAGRKPVWWVFSHRVINYVRMKLWL